MTEEEETTKVAVMLTWSIPQKLADQDLEWLQKAIHGALPNMQYEGQPLQANVYVALDGFADGLVGRARLNLSEDQSESIDWFPLHQDKADTEPVEQTVEPCSSTSVPYRRSAMLRQDTDSRHCLLPSGHDGEHKYRCHAFLDRQKQCERYNDHADNHRGTNADGTFWHGATCGAISESGAICSMVAGHADYVIGVVHIGSNDAGFWESWI